MTRLPAVRPLSASIRANRQGKQLVAESADYLVAHRNELRQFEDVQHLAISTDAEYALPGASPDLIGAAKSLAYQ